jgi:hypothetical protein
MRYFFFLIAFTAVSCQGSLSDDQREKIKDEMKHSKIARVTEVQITEAAFAKGRLLVAELRRSKESQATTDSLVKAEDVAIHWLTPTISSGHPVEIQMLEAYATTDAANLQDNIQKIRSNNAETDSLLYTNPIVVEVNGKKKLDGVWSIWLSKKKLVMAMGK